MDTAKTPSKERSIPVPTTDKVFSARRFRISFSTLINLGALIVLFTVVFALQHLSSTVEEQKDAPTAPAASVQAADDAATAAGNAAVVDLAEMESAPTKKAVSKKAAPKKRSPATRSAQRRGIGWEDRQHSANLVRELDGSYRSSSSTAYRSSAPAPRSYASTDSSYSSRAAYSTATTPYHSDLDDAVARQHYLNANRQPDTAYRTTKTPYPTPVAEPAMYQETTPPTIEASRKPAWEVTVGQR